MTLLWRVCGVNNDRLFGLRVCNEVGVIIATSLPLSIKLVFVKKQKAFFPYTWESIGYAWLVCSKAARTRSAIVSRSPNVNAYSGIGSWCNVSSSSKKILQNEAHEQEY